nr:MAG TPA: hypothetical protein [Caudoviricetes sp.]
MGIRRYKGSVCCGSAIVGGTGSVRADAGGSDDGISDRRYMKGAGGDL